MEGQVDNNQVVQEGNVEGQEGSHLSEREQIEQEALARFKESQRTEAERAEGTPEGYNEDGTPKEDLIDGKFKSQEDLLQAYKELEKKMSQPKEEPKEEPKQPTDENIPTQVDVNKYGQEFVENGSLSEASYSELEKLGFSKQDVDTYIETRQQMGNSFNESIMSKTGGQEGYQELVTWAADNLSTQMINEYNDALAKFDTKRATEILEFMQFRKGESTPAPTRRLEGDADGNGGLQPFTDKNEWQKAMTNRLYGKDPKYTRMVDNRYLTSRKKGIL